VSAQRGIAIVQLVCFLTLLTTFAQKFLSGAFNEDTAAIITASLHNAKKEHQLARKLHATCIVRIADISFMENTSVIIFVFRLILNRLSNELQIETKILKTQVLLVIHSNGKFSPSEVSDS
jgi:hypothetical protein